MGYKKKTLKAAEALEILDQKEPLKRVHLTWIRKKMTAREFGKLKTLLRRRLKKSKDFYSLATEQKEGYSSMAHRSRSSSKGSPIRSKLREGSSKYTLVGSSVPVKVTGSHVLVSSLHRYPNDSLRVDLRIWSTRLLEDGGFELVPTRKGLNLPYARVEDLRVQLRELQNKALRLRRKNEETGGS